MKNRVIILFLLIHAAAFAGVEDCSDQYYGEYSCSTKVKNRLNHQVRLKISNSENSLSPWQDPLCDNHAIGSLVNPLEDVMWSYEVEDLTDLDTDSFFQRSITEVPGDHISKRYQIEFDKNNPVFGIRSASLFIQNQTQANQFCHSGRLLIPSSSESPNNSMKMRLEQNQNLTVKFSDDQQLNLFCKKTEEEVPPQAKNALKTQENRSNLFLSLFPIQQNSSVEDRPFRFEDNPSSPTESKDFQLRTHIGEKPYQCEVCNRRFTQKHNLIVHMKKHTEENPYQCHICNHNFTQKIHLTEHIRTHTGEKPYHCELCNRRFTQKTHLTEHKRTHTKEKPYHCELCNRSYTQKHNLTAHIKTQH
jgi:uncharacterized Zn-finger protein